jgi:tetratricopeptide (TPR) repeat protein
LILAKDAQKRLPDTSEVFYDSNRVLARAWVNYLEGDYRGSNEWWRKTNTDTDFGGWALGPLMVATTDAMGHDAPAARQAMTRVPQSAESDLAWNIAIGAFPALPVYWLQAELGRWDLALADVRKFDAVLEAEKAKKPVYVLMQQVMSRPLTALALAKTGDVAGAQALISTTPLDCYPCLRVRGQVAAEARDWPAAEHWFAEAVKNSPSMPQAYAEWGRMRLDKGDPDGAIAVLKVVAAKAPRYADPPQLWGEALLAKGDGAGASAKFAEAAKLAPHWGRNHLKAGEALARQGRGDPARAELRMAGGLDLTALERAELAAQRP